MGKVVIPIRFLSIPAESVTHIYFSQHLLM